MMKIFTSAERIARPIAINVSNVTKVVKCDNYTLIFLVGNTTAEVAESFETVIERLNG